jgi:hypothetical protein
MRCVLAKFVYSIWICSFSRRALFSWQHVLIGHFFGLVHMHIWWLSLTVPMGLLPSVRPAIHPYTQTIGDIEHAIVFTSLAWCIMGAI